MAITFDIIQLEPEEDTSKCANISPTRKHLSIKYFEENAAAIGSHALGVATEKSDRDYVITFDMNNELNKKTNYFEEFEYHSSLLYFSLQPPTGKMNIILKYETLEGISIDILIVDKATFNIYKQVMTEMKLIPQYLLQDKAFRVVAFERALEHYGFTRNDEISINFSLPTTFSTPKEAIGKGSLQRILKVNPITIINVALVTYFGRAYTAADLGYIEPRNQNLVHQFITRLIKYSPYVYNDLRENNYISIDDPITLSEPDEPIEEFEIPF